MDSDIKHEFVATAHIHGKTFSDLLDEGAIITLDKVNLKKSCAEHILKLEAELATRRAQMEEIEQMELMTKPVDTDNENPCNIAREDFYQRNKKSIMESFNCGKLANLNYNNMVTFGGFKNKKEAFAWTQQRIASECTT